MPKAKSETPPERFNRVLASIPPTEFRRLEPHLEALDLPRQFNLYEVDRPVAYVYFVHSGVASLTSPLQDGQPVEIATVGPEGAVGLPLFLNGDRVAHRAFMQVPGNGMRIAAGAFRRSLKVCPTLNQSLQRYTLALIQQVGQTAACNRAHSVEQRCARWLLMTHDRVYEASFSLTQDFLAQMLGVRRPTVSIAASMLARAGLISYVRGQITIVDRGGLERAACECYRIVTEQFRLLTGNSNRVPLRRGK